MLLSSQAARQQVAARTCCRARIAASIGEHPIYRYYLEQTGKWGDIDEAADSLLWAGVQYRLVIIVPVDEIHGVVVPQREGDIADQRAARNLTFDLGVDGVSVP